MEINLKITKEAFDLAIPSAKEPKGIIFGKLKDKIDSRIEDIACDILGAKGIEVVNGNLQAKLASKVAEFASVDIFLKEIRNLDLVLTSTGFGVVSTNDTAPASKIRVDALDGELRVKRLMLYDDILNMCFGISDWYSQGLVVIDTLFCFFKLLSSFGGLQAPLAKDWENAQSVILSTDRTLREKISDEFMEELITGMATNSLSAPNRGIVHQIRRIIGMAIQGNSQTLNEYMCRLMNTLESDLDTFSTYHNSIAFECNHFKPYENKEESGAFHFVG